MNHLKIDWKKLMIRVVCILCVICLLLTMLISAGMGLAEEVQYETVEVREGTLIAVMKTNVRQGPGTNHNILTQMKPGETCIVTGQEGDWYSIEYGDVKGYIAAEYIEVKTYSIQVPVATPTPKPTAEPTATAEPTPEPTATPMPGYEWVEVKIGTINALMNVNLREGAGTEYDILLQMAPGDECKLTDDEMNAADGEWYQVEIGDEIGYVFREYVDVRIEMVQMPIPTPVPTETPEITATPEPTAEPDPEATQRPDPDPGYEWVEITIGTLNAQSKTNIRKGAGTEHDIVGHMSPGDTCQVLGESGDWYQIVCGAYEGYISKEYIDLSLQETQRPIPTATPVPEETAAPGYKMSRVLVGTVISEGGAAIMKEADYQSEIMTYMMPGKTCFVLDDDMEWYEIQYGGYVGFVAKEYLAVEKKTTQVPLITPSPVPTAEPTAKPTQTPAPDMEYEDREVTVGTVIARMESNVRKGAGTDYDVLTQMQPGDTCIVTGEENGWYRVETEKGTGFISKDLMSLSTEIRKMPVATPEPVATPLPSAMPGYEWVEKMEGTLIAREDTNIRQGPGTNYSVLSRMKPGDICQVLAEDGDWYRIEFGGVRGYILSEFIETRSYMEQVEIIIEPPLDTRLVNLQMPHVMRYRETYSMQGVVDSNVPLTGVTVSVYDRRNMTEEMSCSVGFDRDQQVYEFDLRALDEQLRFRRLTAGEKRMTVTAYSTNDQQVILDTNLYVLGEYDGLLGITGECTLDATAGRADRIRDNRSGTAWQPETAGDILTITAPSDIVTDTLILEWNKAPQSFELRLDGESTLIENEQGLLRFNIPTEGAARMTVRVNETGAGIAEARVYAQGRVPDMVQNWQAAGDKVDMMVIAAHPGDEFLYFGGAIPQAVAEGKSVLVVYMADCGFERYAEAMDGLWAAGVKLQPVSLNMRNGEPDDYDEAVEMWGLEESYKALVDVIRQYRPDVLLTHDVEGENGDEQHKLTSATLRRAILLAIDPDTYPESAAEYGVWDVKKTYIHRYEGNVLAFDPDAPVEALGGWSLREMVQMAFSKYRILQDDFDLEDGEAYSPYSYGVVRSSIEADDVEKKTFFENIESAENMADSGADSTIG